MPRPQKKRVVCSEPKHCSFIPKNRKLCEKIILTVDEYETIRLIDNLKYTQEDCAKQMNVSRTTAQGIYMSARSKIADAIVNGKELKILGGDYIICNHKDMICETGCRKNCCRRHFINEENER